jgi:hypothetical protein
MTRIWRIAWTHFKSRLEGVADPTAGDIKHEHASDRIHSLLCAAVVLCTTSVVWAFAHPYQEPLLHNSYGWLALTGVATAMIGVFLLWTQMIAAGAPARNKPGPDRGGPEPGVAPGSATRSC